MVVFRKTHPFRFLKFRKVITETRPKMLIFVNSIIITMKMVTFQYIMFMVYFIMSILVHF